MKKEVSHFGLVFGEGMKTNSAGEKVKKCAPVSLACYENTLPDWKGNKHALMMYKLLGGG